MSKYLGKTMDEQGYPYQEYLDWIKNYNILAEANDVEYFISVIMDNWVHGDMGYKLYRTWKGYRSFELHTLGWSGNEEVFRSLEQNELFFLLFWRKSEVGGHYYFRIPVFYFKKKTETKDNDTSIPGFIIDCPGTPLIDEIRKQNK